MKIKDLYFQNVGPLSQRFCFRNEWRGGEHERILFSGPNGTGKTIILRTIAMLWEAVGFWLDKRKLTPANYPIQKWIKQKQAAAMVLTDLPHIDKPVVVFIGNIGNVDFQKHYKNGVWIGESLGAFAGDVENGAKRSLWIPDEAWIDDWADARKKLILTFEKSDTPNMVWLDAEQRRWVAPKRNLGQPLPEDSGLRWLAAYQATEDWKGQIEASLINLKSTKLRAYHQVIRDLNDYFFGKELDPKIEPGENRIRVVLKNSRGKYHLVDDLSAGEHQVMIQLYMISRWFEHGGVALIDEPDLFLHPSLIPGFLSKLESMVAEKNGQLIITSHNPDVWSRYERNGLRVRLGDNQ